MRLNARSLLDAVTRQAERAGIALLVRRIPQSEHYPQSVIIPQATYSPWLADTRFLEIYERVRSHTMLDIYRCYELWQLVEQSKKGRGAVIEIGAWRGGSCALIAQRAKDLGIVDTVYCCDTFTGLKKTGINDPTYVDGLYADTSRRCVEELFAALQLDNARVLEGMFPEETAHRIHEQSVRFCHIDVDVYLGAKDIVAWVWPRLQVGGLLVFDDYGFANPVGITRWVEEMRGESDCVVIHNLNGHAVVVKTKP